MKRLLFMIAIGALALGFLAAEGDTNVSAATAAATNAAPNEILIKSETMKGVLTNKVLVAVHRGNVRVNHPRWWTRSEAMTYQIPVAGRRIESLLLESNVFIYSLDEKGRTNSARGNSADYTHTVKSGATNEIVILNGDPAVVVTPDFTMTSSRIICDLVNGTFDGGTNYQMKINAEGLGGSTNGPSLDLFKRP